MRHPEFLVRSTPPEDGKFRRIEAVACIGGYHGLLAILALLGFLRPFIKLEYIFIDEDNPGEDTLRFWRFFSKAQRQKLRNNMVNTILSMGYPARNIIRGKFDPEKFCTLIRESKELTTDGEIVVNSGIEFILAASFTKIPSEAIDLVGGRLIIVHPTPTIPGNSRFLPVRAQGARVMDLICNSSAALFKIVLLKGLKIVKKSDYDAGPILSITPSPQFGPVFSKRELPINWKPGDEDPPRGSKEWKRLAKRVRAGQRITAQEVAHVLHVGLLRHLISLDYAMGCGMSAKHCIEQGWEKGSVMDRLMPTERKHSGKAVRMKPNSKPSGA